MAPGLVARMVVGLILAFAGTTHAERRQVAVIDLSASAPASQLAGELSKALNDHPDLKPLDNPVLTAALQGPFDDEDAPHLMRARKYKSDAEDALAQLDDATAARAARNGMDELAVVHPTAEMLGLYADLAFAYGQAQIGLRKPNDAALLFQLAHRLDPAKAPDPTRYQPNIVDAFRAAADKKTVTARLVVRGEGRVWIDGVEQGAAGNQFETSEGQHLVQLTGPDRETRGDQVLVPSSAPLNIAAAKADTELKVKRARIALSRARDPAERASSMKKLATLLGVGDAVLIANEGTGLTVQTWRDREPGFSALVVHHDEEPLELLRPLAPPKKVEPKPEPIPLPPPIVVEKRWYQKNWVRASIAGGVIAGVVSAILIARRDQNLPPWDQDIQAKEAP
ncbi:MAG TPA: hypothetical protein VIV40_37715 [Kofleriaceae bacterium]